MKLTLKFIRESESGAARLYESKDGKQHWIGRSLIERCLKWPSGLHEIEIPEWKAREMGY
jgi:hypothetical protein